MPAPLNPEIQHRAVLLDVEGHRLVSDRDGPRLTVVCSCGWSSSTTTGLPLTEVLEASMSHRVEVLTGAPYFHTVADAMELAFFLADSPTTLDDLFA